MSATSFVRRGLHLVWVAGVTLIGVCSIGIEARAQTAQQLANCEDAFHDSGIVWTGSSVGIVATPMGTNGGNLYYFWQPSGGTAWHRELVAAANACPPDWASGSAPVPTGYRSNAIAWTGDSIAIAAVDQRNGDISYWWQAKNDTVWHQQTVATGPPHCCQFYSVINGNVTPLVIGYSMPSIAWTGESVVIAASDKHGLHYWFQKKGETTWYHEIVSTVRTGAGLSQPAIAWTGSSVVIADSCDGTSGLCYYWQPAGSATWHRQVVAPGSPAFPSIAWTGTAVAIVALEQPASATGDNDDIAAWWQSANAATWTKEQIGPSAEWSFPAVATAGRSVVVASAEQNLNAQYLDYWWREATSNAGWTHQRPAGTSQWSGVTGPHSLAFTGASVVMTTTDACGDLEYWWQQTGTSPWHKQQVAFNENWPPGRC